MLTILPITIRSGLSVLIDNVALPDDLASAYKDPGQLISTAQQLDSFLPTATDDARTFLKQLEDKILARRIIENASEHFCEDFEEIEGIILQADEIRAGQVNGEMEDEVWLRDVFPRTGDEIRVLLS